MFELFLTISRAAGVLVAIYLVVNAVVAVQRVRDPALRYGRIALGIMGLGSLFGRAEYLLSERWFYLTAWFQVIGLALMLIGVVRLLRLYRKFPSARNRSINLFSYKL